VGDRANVVVQQGVKVSEVFLYTHWGGLELPAVVTKALQDGQRRWDDAQYLARMVFCRMICGTDGKANPEDVFGKPATGSRLPLVTTLIH
jgi:hypothetical protein